MESSTEIKQQPIKGRWAEDALKFINLEWMFGVTQDHPEFKKRRAHVKYWCGIAKRLKLDDQADEVSTLRQLQEYISETPYSVRCPCKRQIAVSSAKDHWPGCDNASAARAWDAIDEKLKGSEKKLQTERHLAWLKWSNGKYDAQGLNHQWRKELVIYLSDTRLKEIHEAVSAEIKDRAEYGYNSLFSYFSFHLFSIPHLNK